VPNKISYPYQQLELDDLKGELWEDLPFLDGLYRISNFGRIKRLTRETKHLAGSVKHLPEKIMICYVSKSKNDGVGDNVFSLSASATVDGKKYKFQIARLVYYCFMKQFDLDNLALVVLPKDGDGKNVIPSNLKLSSIKEKQIRIFERNRWHVDYSNSFDEFKEGKIKSENPYTKQISNYNLKGKRLKTFPSIRVAAKVTGNRETNILNVLKKRCVTSGGFVWAYGKKKIVDVAAIRKANSDNRKLLVGRKVIQYSLDGNKICSHITISDAADKAKTNASDIHAVLNGKQRSAGGFIWKDGIGKNKINTKGFLTGEAWRSVRRQKKVNQTDKSGKVLRCFPSFKDAAKFMGVNNSSISIAVSRGSTIHGTYWKLS
jgi:hypothetical protein